MTDLLAVTGFLIAAFLYGCGAVLFIGMSYWAPVIRHHKFMVLGAFFWPLAGFVLAWMGAAEFARKLEETDLPP